jgi:phage-related protein
MKPVWRIEYWESGGGDSPVYEFIEKLSIRAQSKVSHTFDLLEEFGLTLGLPHVKKVKGCDFWELRILGNDSIRFFYLAVVGHTFLVLHGFMKKQNKTLKKELKIAQVRLREYRSKKLKI